MANITLRGSISFIDESKIYGNFEKRVFWIEEQNVQYPNTWQLECQQNDCNLLDNFQTGQEVDCSINIRGRYWEKPEEGRSGVINTLRCWKITPVGQQPQQSQPQGQYRQPQQQQRTYSPPQQKSYIPPQQQAAPQQQYRQPAQPQKQYAPPQQNAPQQQPQQSHGLQNDDESDLPF